MAGSIATGIFIQGVLVVTGILVARELGAANRGVLALVFILSAVVIQLGSLGVPYSVTYWIAAKGVEPRSLLRGLRRFRGAQLLAVLLAQALLIVEIVEPRSPNGYALWAFSSLAATAGGLSLMYNLGVLQGDKAYWLFNMLRVFSGVLYCWGIVLLSVLGVLTLNSVTLAIVVSSVIAALVTMLIVYRRVGRDSQAVTITTRPLVSFGVRSLFGSASPLEVFRLDQLVVGLLLSPIVLGYYVVALAFSNLARFVGQSIGVITFPQVAALSTPRTQLRVIRKHFALGVILCGVLTIALFVSLPTLLPLMVGSEFRQAVSTGQVLLIASFVAAVRRILIEGARGLGMPLWGTVAEVATLLSLPGVAIAAWLGEPLVVAACAVLLGNLVGFLVIAPVLVGVTPRRRGTERPCTPDALAAATSHVSG